MAFVGHLQRDSGKDLRGFRYRGILGFLTAAPQGRPAPQSRAGYAVPFKQKMRRFIFASNKCGVRLGTKVWTKILLYVPPSRACI